MPGSKCWFRVATFLCAIALTACGDSSTSADARPGLAPQKKGSPVGVWERRWQDAVGQPYFEVLEMFDDGVYVRHASGWSADRGRYSLDEGTLSFRSDANQRHNRDVQLVIRDGETMSLTLDSPTPSPVVEEWWRSGLRPNFTTVDIDGRHVPQGLPDLVAAAFTAEALPWQADALLTGVNVEEQQNGHYAVSFSFYSPSSVAELTVTVTPYDVGRRTGDGSRTSAAPLLPDFLDLREALAVAHAEGVSGPLRKARLSSYTNYGAAWLISTTSPRGVTISAESGERIDADVTGYVAHYEADWDRAGELWRQALQSYAGCDIGETRYLGNCETSRTMEHCLKSGGQWKKSDSHSIWGGYCDHLIDQRYNFPIQR